jgi:hypothetical protein
VNLVLIARNGRYVCVLWNEEEEKIFVRIRKGQSGGRDGTEHTAKKRKYNKSSGRAVSGSCE